MSDALAALSLQLRGLSEDGTEEELIRELRRSMVPWGILERAIELQDVFEDIDVGSIDKEQFKHLTDFVIFVFDDKVTTDEINRYASVEDMFSIYTQIMQMVTNSTAFKNPTGPQTELKKVRAGKGKKSRKRK